MAEWCNYYISNSNKHSIVTADFARTEERPPLWVWNTEVAIHYIWAFSTSGSRGNEWSNRLNVMRSHFRTFLLLYTDRKASTMSNNANVVLGQRPKPRWERLCSRIFLFQIGFTVGLGQLGHFKPAGTMIRVSHRCSDTINNRTLTTGNRR